MSSFSSTSPSSRLAEHRTSQAVENLRKLENLIRASDEISDEDDDADEALPDPMSYKYEILGHTEADWDPLELQLSPNKQSSVSTIEQLSRMVREQEEEEDVDQQETEWPHRIQVRNIQCDDRVANYEGGFWGRPHPICPWTNRCLNASLSGISPKFS